MRVLQIELKAGGLVIYLLLGGYPSLTFFTYFDRLRLRQQQTIYIGVEVRRIFASYDSWYERLTLTHKTERVGIYG